MPRSLRKSLATTAFAVLIMGLPGCGDETTQPPPSLYLEQTSPENVLNNLQVAYRRREVDQYAKLLADDFQFHFDESTQQQQGLPAVWTRTEDRLGTGNLFAASNVTDIRIELTFGTPKAVNEPGRTTWLQIDVLDTFLEVDQAPQPGEPEGTTFRVDGQLQQFFFRKGKSAADTLATSPTADLYFLVEWHDFGFGNTAPGLPRSSENSTWGSIKSAYN